jgi:hypothetical protein
MASLGHPPTTINDAAYQEIAEDNSTLVEYIPTTISLVKRSTLENNAIGNN